MADLIQMRRDIAANWSIANPILADGELGFETDTKLYKMGDGVTRWNALEYQNDTPKIEMVPVDELPAPDVQEWSNKLVLVPASDDDGNFWYDMYVLQVSDEPFWKKVGSMKIGTSAFATKDDLEKGLSEIFEEVEETWNRWMTQKNVAGGWAGVDKTTGKVPSSLIDSYTKQQSDGRYILQSDKNSLPYIKQEQKGAAGGVAELNSERKVYNDQLNWAMRGNLTADKINATDLESGFYRVIGLVMGADILQGDQANGVLVQYSDGYKEQQLIVGRQAGNNEQVEIYTRRYLPTPKRWTAWNNLNSKDQYTLEKSGTSILLKKNGVTISTITDSNTTYTSMSQSEANSGTDTTGRLISAKVLKTTIQNMLDNFSNLSLIPVDVLPTASADTKNGIYLVPRNNTEQDNIKDEYITIETEQNAFVWEKIGSTDIDLSNYSTTEEMMEAIASELQQALRNYLKSAYEVVDELPAASAETKGKFYILEEDEDDNAIIEVTYSELKNIRDSQKLVAGQQYRISDFVTIVGSISSVGIASAQHPFDIIVTAVSKSSLSEDAKAIQHDGDTYFANSNLNAWEIKYSLDNDLQRFSWANTTSGKGVIYWMKDEFENECPYDFKNIQFDRKLDSKGNYSTTGSSTYCYTFNLKSLNNPVSDFSLTTDGGKCFGNKINAYYNVSSLAETHMTLPNIVLLNTTEYVETICDNNIFGQNCRNITVGSHSRNNVFGNDCQNNVLGVGSRYNTFGGYCCNIVLGTTCYYNTICDGSWNVNIASYTRQLSLHSSVLYANITGEGITSSNYIKNVEVIGGNYGTSAEYGNIEFAVNAAYPQVAYKSVSGEIVVMKGMNDEYTLEKSGTNIILNKNGVQVSSVADSNTTYSVMTAAQATAGTSTTGLRISPKVLNDKIEEMLSPLITRIEAIEAAITPQPEEPIVE